MTPQEALDLVYVHFIVQRHMAGFDHIPGEVNEQGEEAIRGRLRDTEGDCCSIGVLIPDQEYRKEMEEWSFRKFRCSSRIRPIFSGMTDEFLFDLLLAHDDSLRDDIRGGMDFHEVLETRLQDIARCYDLQYPVAKEPTHAGA